jgi:hypothetical protein
MDKLDKDIFYYLIVNTDNSLLQKYRDYFPICNNIPITFDLTIFIIVYILYIPIIVCIIGWKHLKQIYNDIKLHIKHPLLLSKGMAYNAVIPYITRGNELTSTTFNKIYWFKLFRKLNIPTPEVAGTIKDGIIKWRDKYISNKYIIKEVHGCCGKKVRMFNKKDIPPLGYYIIQQYIGSGKTHDTYRIITNSHNNKIEMLEMYMLSNDKLVTNISQGGSIKKINNLDTPILKKCIEHSIDAHKRINCTYKCNTIGWDIIIHKEKAYFLEGNIGVRVDDDKYIKYVNVFYKNFV